MSRYWIKLWSCRDALSARSVCNVQRAAFNAISFDNAHPAQVGGGVVDMVRVFQGAVAVVFFAQVEGLVGRLREFLKPLVRRLEVDGARFGEALSQRARPEVDVVLLPLAIDASRPLGQQSIVGLDDGLRHLRGGEVVLHAGSAVPTHLSPPG